MATYSMKDIIASLSDEKKKADGIWTFLVLRPLSYPITWVAIRMGIGANAVSYASVLFSLIGGILLAFYHPLYSLLGVILLNIFSVMDCVDGNIARVTKTASPWGGWADAVMGHVASVSIFISSGVYAYFDTGWWGYILLGGLASSSNLLMRVAYQMYKNIERETAKESVSFEMMLAETFGITGLLMPALIICHIFGGMEYIVLFNVLFYTGGCVVTLMKIALKGRVRGTITN